MDQLKCNNGVTILLALLLTLVGCVESKIMIVPAAATYESIPAQSGVVMVRVVDASNTPYPINYVTLAPEDVFGSEENKFSRIEASDQWPGGNSVSSTVYVAIVPAATYSLSDLRAYYVIGENYYANTVPATPAFGTFEVAPGRLTNLGTIILYPKPDGDRYSEVLVRNDSFEDANDYLNEIYPDIATGLSKDDATLTWNEDGYEAERQSQYLSVVQNPIAFGQAYIFDDEVVILAKAGAILRRNEQGDWTLDAVESDLNLLGFDKNQRGDEVVSGELGTLFFKPGGSLQWTPMKFPTVAASVTGVAVDDDGRVFAYVTRTKSITLYSAEISESPEWETLLVYRSDRGWVSPDGYAAIDRGRTKYAEDTGGRPKRLRDIVGPVFFEVDGRHYFIEKNELFRINPLQASATQINLDFSIINLAPFRDQLTAIHKPSLLGAWTYSTGGDFDGEWMSIRGHLDRCPGLKPERKTVVCPDRPVKKLDPHDHIGIPRFDSPTHGYSILRKKGRPSKGTYRKFLAGSQDGGRTWVPLEGQEDFPQYCNQLLPVIDTEKILIGCNGTTGKIYEFDIASTTWSLVWEPNTF